MSRPRIIAGEARGQHLKSVPGNITRPITDKVKEALFNILGNGVYGCHFLDLFGGTGSVGLEALSRGANLAVLIDVHRAAYATIKENVLALGFKERAEVYHQDALKFLEKAPETDFDYIYIAPPQYKAIWKEAITKVDDNPAWLHADGEVIVQIDVLEYEEMPLKNLHEVSQRRYGDTLLVFYEKEEEPNT